MTRKLGARRVQHLLESKEQLETRNWFTVAAPRSVAQSRTTIANFVFNNR